MLDRGTTFSGLAGSLDSPLFIVTAADGERREGCVIGFATQCSIHPPRFLACLSRANRTFRLALAVEELAVHLLAREQIELAQLFGGETGDEIDKFERCAWSRGPRGLPILEGCPAWFAGDVLARHDLGDHVGFLLDPFEARREADVPLLFMQSVRALIEPGHPAT